MPGAKVTTFTLHRPFLAGVFISQPAALCKVSFAENRLDTRLSQPQQPIASEKPSFADLCNCSAAQAFRMLPALRGCGTARLTRSPPSTAGSRPSRMRNSSAHPIPAGYSGVPPFADAEQLGSPDPHRIKRGPALRGCRTAAHLERKNYEVDSSG